MADNKTKTADEAYAEWQKSGGKDDAALADRVANLEKMAGVSAGQAGVA